MTSSFLFSVLPLAFTTGREGFRESVGSRCFLRLLRFSVEAAQQTVRPITFVNDDPNARRERHFERRRGNSVVVVVVVAVVVVFAVGERGSPGRSLFVVALWSWPRPHHLIAPPPPATWVN